MRVLLVEQQQADADWLSRFLRQYTPLSQVKHVASGMEALTAAAHHRFELILLGLPLPDIDLQASIPLLRRQNNTAGIIGMIPWEERAELQNLLAVGMSDFIFKPFQEAELVLRLQRFLPGAEEAAAGLEAQQQTKLLQAALSESKTKYQILFFALQESEKRYRTLIENLPLGVYRTEAGPEGKILMANSAFCHMLGYSSASELIGTSMRDLYFNPTERDNLSKSFTSTGKTLINGEIMLKKRDGSPVCIADRARIVYSDKGEALYFDCTAEDITQRKKAEEALKNSEERYRGILASIEEGYYETDLSGQVTFCNDAACRFIGYTREELIGMPYQRLYKKPELANQTFQKVYSSGQPESGFPLEMIRKDGQVVCAELSISLIKDKDGKITGFRGVTRDITERKKYEDQLKYLSMHDQLTGLYNRTYFEEELQRLEGGRNYPITILCADVDGLKLVNDSMGHKQGDDVLIKCAQILKQHFRNSDVLARVGGDEFAIILPRTGAEEAEVIYRRIHKSVEIHNSNNPLLPLGISMGHSTALDPRRTLDVVYKEADSKMYREKLHHCAGSQSQVIDTLLAALTERDYIAEGHATRLQELSLKMGKKLGLSAIQLADLSLLARVHDLGKVGIPDRILFKNGPLARNEQKIMQQHPEKGFRIARASQDLASIADLILRHHERWDGEGYPLGLKGKEIPIECRILAIVDAFDAMVHDRPYRKALSIKDALAELKRSAGSQFDPELVDLFVQITLEDNETTG